MLKLHRSSCSDSQLVSIHKHLFPRLICGSTFRWCVLLLIPSACRSCGIFVTKLFYGSYSKFTATLWP